ncbi:MAG: hypothetical protein Q9226_004719 [Calogaya cf. arnoldii]
MKDNHFTFRFVNASETIALGSALPAVCVVVIGLRFLTRRLQNVKVGMDDWLALCGLFAVIGMGACLIAGASLGSMGYPTPAPPESISPEELPYYLDPATVRNQKIELPFRILTMLAYGAIKVSIVSFYRRIFVVHRGSLVDILTRATSAVIILWASTFILLVIFACGIHFWANWGLAADDLLYCRAGFITDFSLVISDLILDVFIFLMPLPLIWRLHLTTSKKLSVSGIFLLGASAVGASIARLILYVQILGAITAGIDVDHNLFLTVSYYWCLLEAGLSLIAACLPPMSYLFTRTSINSVIHSIRSALSLESLRWSSQSKSSRIHIIMRDEHDMGHLVTPTKDDGYTASWPATQKGSTTDRELSATESLEGHLPTHRADIEFGNAV